MIHLVRERLEDVQADAYGYGAKDTGEMGGGAASSIVANCGEAVLEAVRTELATTNRLIGTAVITDAFNLRKRGVKYVLHIISIIKNTPQGAYCPTPERLPEGVELALKLAYTKGCRSVALAAVATGEGRVPPREAARLMLTGVARFQNRYSTDLTITFCLPTTSDYEAFQAVLGEKSSWGG